MPSASVMVRVTGGGGACIGAGDCTRGPWSRPANRGAGCRADGASAADTPACRAAAARDGRTGCDGSGRGPPMADRARRQPPPGRGRRTRRHGPGVLRAAGAAGGSDFLSGPATAATARVQADGRASGAAAARAAPGRCADLRRAAAASAARCGPSGAAAPNAAARRCRRRRPAADGAGDARGCPSAPAIRGWLRPREVARRLLRADRRTRRARLPVGSCEPAGAGCWPPTGGAAIEWRGRRLAAPPGRRRTGASRDGLRLERGSVRLRLASSRLGGSSSVLGCGRGRGRIRERLGGLDEPRRRQRRRGRLGRLRRLAAGLLALRTGAGVSANEAFEGTLSPRCRAMRDDELPRDDLFDRARRALHLDAVIALEQRHHFLARGVEKLRDFVNPDCCHSLKFKF